MTLRAAAPVRERLRSILGLWRAVVHSRWVRRAEAVVWLALAVFAGYRIWPQAAAAFGIASSEALAPEFRLTTLDGQEITTAGLRGKVVLVNFWATWCPPCRVEMPGFQAVYDEFRDSGFVVLGISTDTDGQAKVEEFLRQRRITYPVAMAAGNVTNAFGGADLLPTSYLIDRQGRVRNEVRGIFASIALRRAVNRLLSEPDQQQARAIDLW